ncbi:MAG TPA: hypothetical protein PLO37_21505 [Candidatus Hydrogenedentes bacterium]|nr:hypothetical protein [Candidatus Hydrogenedentota bacterium]HPG69430.1 hypothetical protein [Candidatus Hydrogenedentota bacterium]
MSRTVCLAILTAFLAAVTLFPTAYGEEEAAMTTAPEPSMIRLETDRFCYGIAPDGKNAAFIDKKTGQDYADLAAAPCFAQAKAGGATLPASGVTYADGQLTVRFGDGAITAIVGVETKPDYLTFEVLDVAGENVEELALPCAQLTTGGLDAPFVVCALALNLQTDVREIPGPNKVVRALCYPKFGLVGAKVAVIACAPGELRDVMKAVVSAAEELPRTDIGGPWALDAAINRGSYLFDFGNLNEDTADGWIALVKRLGLNQIDFHTGGSLRFGDYEPNATLFPNGRASVKATLDKLHAAGIAAGLHTYAFFIAKNSKYVTPVPDPRLGKDATFTLAAALDAAGDQVPVTESTESMSTTTGFFVRNSVTLQIDDELITYSAISKEAPYAFTGCTRGAFGTTAAAHAEGAKVEHLKECFGLFTPDADSTLLAEVAQNTADTYNECGFDMIYLDALDGEGILGGNENAWHYGSKFVFEIATRLDKPALFEMSTFHHHLWYVRARMGAWDHPSRAHKRFVDVHCAANRSGAGMFLPMTLGWWAVKAWSDGPYVTQIDPTFPDDIEYLMAKCLGNDMGFALMGVNPGNIDSVPAYERLAPIFRQYEELRHAGYFPESVKAALREPGKEFTLEQAADGGWQFRRVACVKQTVAVRPDGPGEWTVDNPFGAQPVQVRIEALLAAAPYDSPDGVIIEDFGAPDAYSERPCREGVTVSLGQSTDCVQVGERSGLLTAANTRDASVGAWAQMGRVFSPPLDIRDKQALGLWVHGDGRGELLNVQLRSPEHTTELGLGDHYIPIDFTGWRYFELVEPDSGRIEDYSWPYGGAYAVYREHVDYGQVKRLSFWFNNLPAAGEASCCIGPVKALPLAPVTIANPRITIGDKTVTFPTSLETGAYIEFRTAGECVVYGKQGETIGQAVPQGDAPILAPGSNTLRFECDSAGPNTPRVRIAVFALGDVVSP